MKAVKVKVFLGYFTLVLLGSLIIWVIYSEILYNSREKADLNPANNKFIYINTILTNLYQAEGLERSYAQSGQKAQYQHYIKLMDTISLQIDTLALMVNSPIQQMHTDSFKKLLVVKQHNLKELSDIRKKNSTTSRYQEVIKKLSAGKDSVDRYKKIYKYITTNKDSIYIKQKKKKFFERLANVFSAREKTDSNLHVLTTQSVQVDSLLNPISEVDTITGFVTAVMTQIRDESVAIETQMKLKEQEVMDNDRTLTLQLRQMLSDIENEELMNSYQKVYEQQSRIEKKTWLIIFVGGFALVTILFFLANILKDITRSQHYRQSLEDAKAFSESLLKSKEQLMLSLTHDLKSPLNSIIGFTGFIQEDKDIAPRHQKYLRNISKASNHILNLVNDLLDLARLETGKLTIDHIPCDLRTLIEDIVERFRPMAIEKEIGLELESTIEQSISYLTDPIRITQVVSNLISNAIKFTDTGKVSVTVLVSWISEKKDEVIIEVADTGIGISEENIRLVFKEFSRVATSKQHEGTGLGLAITQKLVHLLHGTIQLESKPEAGSRFAVILPLEKTDLLPDSTIGIVPVQNQEVTSEIKGGVIWLIDDDQTLLEMTTTVLLSAGFEVHSFNDPVKAVESFRKGCADLLITDIQMPGMVGFEVVELIREKNGGEIKAIAISGSERDERAYAGFTAFIQKPFNPQTFIKLVSLQLCDSQKGRKEEAEALVSPNNHQNEYNLEQIAAFADGDAESLKQILVSFINTGKQNAVLLRQYLIDENDRAISDLSHKMLPLYRQLEANEIVELLSNLEHKDPEQIFNRQDYSNGKSALDKICSLLDTIQKEEHIRID